MLKVDSYVYRLKIGELMKSSRILAQYRESMELAAEVFGNVEHYRDDFYWHNAYKTRIRQAVPEEAYTMSCEKKVALEAGSCYRLRVHLRNGDTAWVSPIFVRQ